MGYMIIKTYLPATGGSYDIRVPEELNVMEAANLMAKALSEISDGRYLSSRNCCLAWKKTGGLLDMRKTLKECNVENGSEIILI